MWRSIGKFLSLARSSRREMNFARWVLLSLEERKKGGETPFSLYPLQGRPAMTRPGSETPAPPSGDDAGPISAVPAAASTAISPADPRLGRCAFAVLRGKNVHELPDGTPVDEYFVRTFDVTLGRRSRGGGADVVISGS